MSEPIYLTTIGLFLGVIVIVFGMKYFAAVTAARAQHASADAYRILAEKATAAQLDNQALLKQMQGELARVSAKLATVEKILSQVE